MRRDAPGRGGHLVDVLKEVGLLVGREHRGAEEAALVVLPTARSQQRSFANAGVKS